MRLPLWLPCFAASLFAWPQPAIGARPVRLVSVVVLDQFASNLADRYQAFLPELGRLRKRGAFYANGVHDQASTVTAPGHASIMTGTWPSIHGIVSNRWHRSTDGSLVHCVGTPGAGRTPEALEAPTVADTMKLASGGQSKTVGLALKARASILSSGKRPNVAIWYEEDLGRFLAAPWGSEKAPKWLAATNLERGPNQAFGKTWDRFRPTLDYEALAGPDTPEHEVVGGGLGVAFPRRLGAGLSGPNEEWQDHYAATPQAIEALFELSRRAFHEERLGQDEVPDFLFVGVSSLDLAGHLWGPESQESLDLLLRIDHELGGLVREVEESIGRDSVLWVVTGDHGIAPTPEYSARLGLGGRISEDELKSSIESALAPLSKGKAKVSLIYGPMIFLSHQEAERPEDRLKLARAAAQALRKHPLVAEAQPGSEAELMSPEFRNRYLRARFPGREPDVFVRFKPGVLVGASRFGKGSRHGSPYSYDTNVPILVAGPGVRHLEDRRPFSITRIAPTIAAVLRIAPPAAAFDAPLPAVGTP